MNTGWTVVAVARLLPYIPHMGTVESTRSTLQMSIVHADTYTMELSPDYFPIELRMGWRAARELRRDIAQEPKT